MAYLYFRQCIVWGVTVSLASIPVIRARVIRYFIVLYILEHCWLLYVFLRCTIKALVKSAQIPGLVAEWQMQIKSLRRYLIWEWQVLCPELQLVSEEDGWKIHFTLMRCFTWQKSHTRVQCETRKPHLLLSGNREFREYGKLIRCASKFL